MGFTLKIINYPLDAVFWAVAGYADGNWVTFEENAGSTELPSLFLFNVDETWEARYNEFKDGGIVIFNAEGEALIDVPPPGLGPMYTGNAYAFDCTTQKLTIVKEIPWKWIAGGVGVAAVIGGGIALVKKRK